MATVAEPRWIDLTCSRGHSLREHGAPRKAHPSRWYCQACRREWERERVARGRDDSDYGWRGDEHLCAHLHEPCEVDEASVRRLMDGDPSGQVHAVDRSEAIRRLTALGMSAAQIARRVRCVPRTVVRERMRERKGMACG